jgi:hypothetical protein
MRVVQNTSMLAFQLTAAATEAEKLRRKLRNNTLKVATQQSVWSYRLVTVAHKVSDHHHLHHE